MAEACCCSWLKSWWVSWEQQKNWDTMFWWGDFSFFFLNTVQNINFITWCAKQSNRSHFWHSFNRRLDARKDDDLETHRAWWAPYGSMVGSRRIIIRPNSNGRRRLGQGGIALAAGEVMMKCSEMPTIGPSAGPYPYRHVSEDHSRKDPGEWQLSAICMPWSVVSKVAIQETGTLTVSVSLPSGQCADVVVGMNRDEWYCDVKMAAQRSLGRRFLRGKEWRPHCCHCTAANGSCNAECICFVVRGGWQDCYMGCGWLWW